MPELGQGQNVGGSYPCQLHQVREPESMRYINISVDSEKKIFETNYMIYSFLWILKWALSKCTIYIFLNELSVL